MLKRFLLAVAAVVCCSTSMFAQDLFLSFSDTALVTEATEDDGASRTAFIFSREGFVFRGLNINLNGTDGSVAAFTGAEISLLGALPAPPLDVAGQRVRFSGRSSDVSSPTLANASAAFVGDPSLPGGVDGGSLLDPAVAGVGVLVGQFDFDTVGNGETTFTLGFNGLNGVLDGDSNPVLNPTAGSGITLTVTETVPEPSSAALLAMGLIGFVARRRRR